LWRHLESLPEFELQRRFQNNWLNADRLAIRDDHCESELELLSQIHFTNMLILQNFVW
jgi:hypothetical protein